MTGRRPRSRRGSPLAAAPGRGRGPGERTVSLSSGAGPGPRAERDGPGPPGGRGRCQDRPPPPAPTTSHPVASARPASAPARTRGCRPGPRAAPRGARSHPESDSFRLKRGRRNQGPGAAGNRGAGGEKGWQRGGRARCPLSPPDKPPLLRCLLWKMKAVVVEDSPLLGSEPCTANGKAADIPLESPPPRPRLLYPRWARESVARKKWRGA